MGDRTRIKKLYQCGAELSKIKLESKVNAVMATSLRINNFLISLPFHCKITDVPFTSVHS